MDLSHDSSAPATGIRESGVLRWRALAALFLAGATIGTVSLLMPHSPGADEAELWINTAFAVAAAAVLWLFARRLPAWMNHACLAGGTIIIARAVYYSGDAESFYAVWYVWIAIYAFSFFERRAAIAHTALVGGSYAAVLALASPDAAANRWVTTFSTVLIAAVLVDRLVRELRRHARAAESSAARLEAVARTDDLTGLPNRRSWDHDLERTHAHARRFGLAFCVALLDLDGFKGLNDRDGHQAGDRMLVAAARRWSAELRDVDTLARWGGDEFAAIVPGTDLEGARAAIERVREATPDGSTCSAGLACWDGVEEIESLIARADEALYLAKRRGRDRVVVHGDYACV